MVGVMPPREALALAESRGLDLIEIAPTATPPTCKIMDYGKYKYENKRKEKEAKKKQTVITVKEIQVRPRTDDHDIDVKVRHARRFILEGDKVKVNLRFMGRELAHQEYGMATLRRVMDMLMDVALVESPPKVEGKQAFLMLAPDPIKVMVALSALSSIAVMTSGSSQLCASWRPAPESSWTTYGAWAPAGSSTTLSDSMIASNT